jgi:hypothetical protein
MLRSSRQDEGKSVSDLIARAQQTIQHARLLRARTERALANFRLVENTGFTFLITDLGLGMTFAQIASCAPKGSAKRTRNQANARRAYDAISRIIPQASLDEKEREEVAGKLVQLRSALQELGEAFVE